MKCVCVFRHVLHVASIGQTGSRVSGSKPASFDYLLRLKGRSSHVPLTGRLAVGGRRFSRSVMKSVVCDLHLLLLLLVLVRMFGSGHSECFCQVSGAVTLWRLQLSVNKCVTGLTPVLKVDACLISPRICFI